LEYVRRAKQEGLAVTCEVTPHHLFLCEDDISDAYDTNLKMNPPLRTSADAAAMREGVLDGTIDCIVTDHAPHAAHEKDCEWEIAYFGCVGLETSLPLMLANFVIPERMSWGRLVELMAINPRRILRLEPVRIAEGSAVLKHGGAQPVLQPRRDEQHHPHAAGRHGHDRAGQQPQQHGEGAIQCRGPPFFPCPPGTRSA
jgi:dihydroorotase